jgi:hypothetical protein
LQKTGIIKFLKQINFSGVGIMGKNYGLKIFKNK